MYFFMQGGIELNMSEINNNKINKQADDDKQENMLKQNTNEYKNSQQVDYTDNNATSVKASTKEKSFSQDKINNAELIKYENKYSQAGFMKKIKKYGKVIGLGVIYKALQLWYVMQKPEVPASTKVIIMGALGYLISPLDFIPDLTPILGYSDDIVAITYALIQVHGYIDDNLKALAKAKIDTIFGAGTSASL